MTSLSQSFLPLLYYVIVDQEHTNRNEKKTKDQDGQLLSGHLLFNSEVQIKTVNMLKRLEGEKAILTYSGVFSYHCQLFILPEDHGKRHDRNN